MERYTLRQYLFDKRIDLYETIDELKSKKIYDCATDDEMRNLEVAEAQLNIIKDVIDICVKRRKY